MQAPQPGFSTVAPARSTVSTRPFWRATFSTAGVLGAGIGRDCAGAQRLAVGAGPHRGDPFERLLVRLDDGRARGALRGHVGERGALVEREGADARTGELHDPIERELRLRILE